LSLALDSFPAFLTLPFGILWSSARAEDMTLVSFDGKILRPSARICELTGKPFDPDMSAICFHAPVHRIVGNERAKAIFHTHQHYATTLACSET